MHWKCEVIETENIEGMTENRAELKRGEKKSIWADTIHG